MNVFNKVATQNIKQKWRKEGEREREMQAIFSKHSIANSRVGALHFHRKMCKENVQTNPRFVAFFSRLHFEQLALSN